MLESLSRTGKIKQKKYEKQRGSCCNLTGNATTPFQKKIIYIVKKP